MSKELIIKKYDIAKPEQATQMARVLQSYINNNKLSVDIQGKKYVMSEGWQFAGFITGVSPIIESVENLSTPEEVKWKATARLMSKGKTIGIGIALCSNKENKKKSFDEYAVLSTAQTRAIGKAYRNLMGWIVKAAGFESTPAEEMKTPEKDMVNEAERMINSTKSVKNLETIGQRIMSSKKFSDEQKKTLEKKVLDRLNELDHAQA